jgi:REP element-mobilizing transposase RayT
MYHVMARGDQREPIVRDDEDRRTFLRTLGEACERAGFGVHAYTLMTNHYHLLLETKEPNLSRGMGWLQNAFTIQKETTVRLDWISETMRMGERSSCCRTIRRTREMMQRRKDWIEVTEKIRGMSTSHD